METLENYESSKPVLEQPSSELSEELKEKIANFALAVGGQQHQNSNHTTVLTILYEDFLEGILSKEQLFDLINKAEVSGPAKYAAKKYVDQTFPAWKQPEQMRLNN